jgi:CDP-diacylglycerol--glycerol-3-phosphate 3-phosphatidyltransferase
MKLTIPNQLTILRILITPIFIFLFLKRTAFEQLSASAIFLIASFTDWYDGWYARRFGVISRWGQFMDPLADKVVVISALVTFAILGYVFWWMVWIIIIRDVIITFNRIYALHNNKPIITHSVAKWKTATQMVTIFLILIFINFSNFYYSDQFTYSAQYFDFIGISMIIVTFLTVLSGTIYVIENRDLLLNILRNVLRL